MCLVKCLVQDFILLKCFLIKLEIKNICKKTIFLISNGWKLNKKEKTLQKRFREVYSKNFEHNINFKSILYLGSKKNYNWFIK